jgi:hypothetical protein
MLSGKRQNSDLHQTGAKVYLMSRKLLCLFALLACLFLVPIPLVRSGDDKPARLPVEAKDLKESLHAEWYGVYLQGKKIGYFNTRREQIGKDPSAGYRESFAGTLKLASFGQKTEVVLRQSLEFDGKPPYALRGGEASQSDGSTGKKTKMARAAKGLEYVLSVGKEQRRKVVPTIDYTLADSLAAELWMKRGRKIGDKIAYRDFDFDRGKADLAKSRVLSEKTSLVGGVKVRYFDVETVSERDGIVLNSLYDETGRLLSGKFGGIFEIRLEPEEQAKNTEYSQDLFVLGMVKIDRPLGDLTKVKALVLEVTGKEAGLLESGPRQTIVANPAGTFSFKLGKAHAKKMTATKEEIEENLKETDAYAISHAKVQALTKQAIGDAKTPEEKVRRLVKFVQRYVEPSLTVSLPEIHDLLEQKKGDCKCYALLFNTLARAAGIPAREVGGLMYIGDDQKAFGGHAWNEVVLGGVWVPIDASLGEAEINATHISFGREMRAASTVLQSLGKLRFRVVEVDNGK